jgi:hypothetical protein
MLGLERAPTTPKGESHVVRTKLGGDAKDQRWEQVGRFNRAHLSHTG